MTTMWGRARALAARVFNHEPTRKDTKGAVRIALPYPQSAYSGEGRGLGHRAPPCHGMTRKGRAAGLGMARQGPRPQGTLLLWQGF